MYLQHQTSLVKAGIVLGLLAGTLPVFGQTYQPAGWIDDPFCTDTNYAVSAAATGNPTFTSNGIQRGSLYASSPIGASLALQPGDMISCSGQVALAGDINPDGNMQFRVGLYYRGDNSADTNWLGYMFGNPTGKGDEADTGLYVRNNPNTTVFSSGAAGHAKRPVCNTYAYTNGWSAGTYEFSLAITQLPGHTQRVDWKLAGEAPLTYHYSGTYTNGTSATCPSAFDQVGILGGADLFQSATATNSISFKELKVSLGKMN